MRIADVDRLDDLSDDQLWETAADTRNAGEVRQEAILRWLFPEDIDPDIDPEELGGSRLRELRERATIIDEEEIEEDDIEDFERSGPYFDTFGRLIMEHDGVLYLIESEDDGAYDGISDENGLYTTDDKTNLDRDL